MIGAPQEDISISRFFRLTNGQIARLKPFFRKGNGRPSVDDLPVLVGIIRNHPVGTAGQNGQ